MTPLNTYKSLHNEVTLLSTEKEFHNDMTALDTYNVSKMRWLYWLLRRTGTMRELSKWGGSIGYLEELPQLDDSIRYLQGPSQWGGSIEYLVELALGDDSIENLQ